MLLSYRFVIHIDSWEPNSHYPNGHFVRSIGPIGNIETETEVILIEHELSAETFSKTLLKGRQATHHVQWNLCYR